MKVKTDERPEALNISGLPRGPSPPESRGQTPPPTAPDSVETADSCPPTEGETAPRASPEPKKKKRSALRAFIALLIKLAVIAALGWALLTYVIDIHVVHSNDMYPSVRDGDLIITYRLREPGRGEVVCYYADGAEHVGRIVGLEGDVIGMDEDGRYTINEGIPLETIYYDTKPDPDAEISYPYTVPAGSMFVLNDLRDNTSDSRRYGAILLDDCDGSAALLLRRRSW